MAKDVQVPRTLLGALTGALFVSLLAIAFLLGRESAEPVVDQTHPTGVQASPDSTPREQSLDERLDRIEQRVNKVQKHETLRVGTIPSPQPDSSAKVPPLNPSVKPSTKAPEQTSTAPATPSSVPENKAYFQQVDSILQNTPSLQDPNEFATKFLQRAMNGDQSEFNALIAATRRSRAELKAIVPPPSCAEHHSLLQKQMAQSEELLVEIQRALSTNDTSRLSSVAARGEAMQAETARLQQLERELRN